MIHLPTLFLHSTHRVGRRGFATGAAILVTALWGTDQLAAWGWSLWATVPLKLLIAYCGLCVLSLRLHDRGRSGWWGWLILLGFGFFWPLAIGTVTPLGIIGAMVTAGWLIDLALMPGQKAFNRYGPPPSSPKPSA